MSNIDKQALREIAAEAVGAHERLSVMPPDDIFDISLAEGTQLDADITALNALNSAANPATVLALLDELEASEKLNAELMEKQRLIDICQGQGLEHRIAAEKRAEAAEKRIAELEVRENVVIIKHPVIGRAYGALNRVWTEQEVRKACELSGIKLNIAAAGKGE